MSATVRAVALANSNTTDASQATAPATVPASTITSDVGLFIMTENLTAPTFTGASGWTSIAGMNTLASNQSTQVWEKDMTTSEAGTAETFSSGTSGRLSGIMAIIAGGDTTLANTIIQYGTMTNVTSGSTITAPTVTTTVAGCLIVTLWSVRAGSTTAPTLTINSAHSVDGSTKTLYSASPNFTHTVSHQTTATGAAGTYGGVTATADQTVNVAMYTLAIPPSPITYNKGQFFPFL
jgi:hypothetical protein